MLCRVEMPANEQIYGRFYRYKMLRLSNFGPQQGGGRSSLILMGVLAAVLVIFAVMSGMYLPAAIVGALVVGYIVFTMYIRPGQIFRKKAGAALNTEVTIFTDNGFQRSVRSEEGGPPDNMSAQYDTLVLAVETGHDFYLFTSPAQAYLIDKEYFTKGAPQELREVLQKKLGKKFKGPK